MPSSNTLPRQILSFGRGAAVIFVGVGVTRSLSIAFPRALRFKAYIGYLFLAPPASLSSHSASVLLPSFKGACDCGGQILHPNPEMGTLVSFHKVDPILSRAPVPPPLGQWTVKQGRQDESTITNADATVYASKNTLFTRDHGDTYSVEDAGFDEFVVRLVAKFFFLLYCP
ncbi:hypothetical protein B0H14DRAFT_3148937, partial [Mycena olivaceomarginata]